MARKIKFRGWHTKEKYILEDIDFLDRDDFELMQFTGLYDKNGKEIYEGDIVSGVNGSINGIGMKFTMSIKWDDHRVGFNIPLFKNDYNPTHYYEVIGNIYENPELLEEKA